MEDALKGLELSRAYFQELIGPLLDEHLPALGRRYAAALIGWGSDVLGYDDAWSRDHEWGPRGQLLLPTELEGYRDEILEVLERHVPVRFRGHLTRFVPSPEDPGVRVPAPEGEGHLHLEVMTCEAYMHRCLGLSQPTSALDWLALPEQSLLGLTRGAVFWDGAGELTRLRRAYAYYPPDVWLYRLAYAWQSLGWDLDLVGLCAARGHTLAWQQALALSTTRLIRLVFLLNKRYAPSYVKWLHAEFYRLPHLSPEVGPVLERCARATDGAEALAELEQIARRLLRFQERLGLMPGLALDPYPFARGFAALPYQRIADQLHASLGGPLRDLPLIGALDQWVGQYDLLLDPARLRTLAAIYRSPHLSSE